MDIFSVICSILIAICMIVSTASSNRQRRWASILPKRLDFDEERLQRASNIFVPSKIDDPTVTFMEDVPEYPERRLKDILLKEGSLHKDLFGTESLIAVGRRFTRPRNKYKHRTYDNVHLRSGMQPETQLCESRVEIVYPKKAENKEGKWKFIVNLEDENHKQGVRVERCIHNKTCSFSKAFPSKYTSVCEQSIVYRRLLAVTEKGDISVDEFKMPSCCMCVIKRN